MKNCDTWPTIVKSGRGAPVNYEQKTDGQLQRRTLVVLNLKLALIFLRRIGRQKSMTARSLIL
ncbi:hypothetical protein AV650_09200 [Serratia fonticola]|nr:hypothetical protein AV650_09200 [Serratia fonticola]